MALAGTPVRKRRRVMITYYPKCVAFRFYSIVSSVLALTSTALAFNLSARGC